MRSPPSRIAPEVYCLGPWGYTQTNVYLVRSGPSSALIDAGWAGDAARIESAVAAVLGPRRPEVILLTHVHPDHSGAAGALARSWGCPVYLDAGDLPSAVGDFEGMVASAMLLDRWIILPMMRAMGTRRRIAVLSRSSIADVARTFEPGTSVPGLPGWERVPTPGHTPGHVSYLRPEDRVLISGDALITLRVNSPAGLVGRQGLSGPPWYTTWDRRRATESLSQLADLEPSVLGGGHGRPLAGPATAQAVRAFAASR
jgi:glyoxylase-like metal-dependent hydrolase (beta-lactamase superfamily II)